MSATRTFTALAGGGAGGAFQTGDKWRYMRAEETRQALDQLAYNSGDRDLGGSDDVGILSTAYVPVVGAREFTLNGDTLGGLTLDVVFYSRVRNAATAVTMRLRNVTDSSDAAVSTPTSLLVPTKEVVTATLASGAKVYRAEVIGSNLTHPVYGYAQLRFRKVAA